MNLNPSGGSPSRGRRRAGRRSTRAAPDGRPRGIIGGPDRIPLWILIAGGVLVATIVTLGSLTVRSAGHSEGQRQAISGTVLDLCGRGDALARELQARGACSIATQARETPSATAPGRTDAEITKLIADYLLAHRQDAAPSTAQVIAAAQAVIASRPDLRGPGPTDQQVASAAAAYITAHKGDFQGEKGETGARGRGVESVRFVRGSGGCESVVTYTDGTTSRQDAGDAACPGGTSAPGRGTGTGESPETPSAGPTEPEPPATSEPPADGGEPIIPPLLGGG